MGRRTSFIALLCGLVFLLLLTGCSRAADELYALPKQSDAYYELQSAMDLALPVGASYSGPLTGSNQQAVQLADLDGDGQEEAIVFMKVPGEKPLKAYIFDRIGDVYENTAVIEGDGTAFDSVEYVQLDENPGMEILIGRQLSNQVMQSLSAYACTEGRMAELMTANYSEFKVVDLDEDDHTDIFVLRLETEERSGVAELYRWHAGRMERAHEANLSPGVKQIKRILTGYIASGVPAVLVASSVDEVSIVTDIFAFSGPVLQNVTANAEAGFSAQTVRSYNVYAADIDEDGIIELPMPVALPSAAAGEGTFWTIEWYNLGPEGERTRKLSTYHNYSAGWYLVLPEQWQDQLTICVDSSGATVFSKWNGYDQPPEPLLTIYGFTGEDRLELAQAGDRTLLAQKGDTAWSASRSDHPWAKALTAEKLTAMFRFIYMDWNSGET